MPGTVTLSIPRPCAESWDAMTPAPGGRHCAACRKVVVDFTQQTDAQILAYLAGAGGREVCARLYADQQHRPLRPAPALPAPAARWRAWLALGLAAWGSRQVVAAPGPAPAPTHRVPVRPAPRRVARPGGARFVQGTVRDAGSGAPLVGVAVFLRGENRQAVTDSNGWFGLRLPPRRPRGGRALVLHFAGYVSATERLPASGQPVTRVALALTPDAATAGAEVVAYAPVTRREVTGGAVTTLMLPQVRLRKPWPWHPRSFYYWSRYWLTRPFRRSQHATDQ